MIKILMVGFGHVGQGFAELLVEKRDRLRSLYGLDVAVAGIVTRRWGALADVNGLPLERVLASVKAGKGFEESGLVPQPVSAMELIESLDYNVLVELSVTNLKNPEPATQFIRRALESGKSVITANKGPIALHLEELETLANEKGVALQYEGTVMSGTPTIGLIKRNLAGLKIRKIEGIVNGSTNYVLCRMEDGLSFEEAVAEAKEKGYLEADPTADLEGWDAVAKVMILAGVAFGKQVGIEQVKRQGISGLSGEEVQRAMREGKTWRLVAEISAEEHDEGGCSLAAKVEPRQIGREHPLAQIKGTENALVLHTDVLPMVTIKGPGAGGRETGFAVLSDLLAIYTTGADW